MLFRAAVVIAEEPGRYVVDFPPVGRFCLPVETYLEDVSQTVQEVGGRTFSHQLNGGYGLPVVAMAGGQHLLHLGADVAWYQNGAPVYAIADGVVRISRGPPPPGKAAKAVKNGAPDMARGANKAKLANLTNDAGDLPLPSMEMAKTHATDSATKRAAPTGWGNLVVIEHRLPDGKYFTSIYGHLATKRLVVVGDIVQAGDMIGAIGKTGIENGGFKPHLHFALREGRMFEPGCTLFTAQMMVENVVADSLPNEGETPEPPSDRRKLNRPGDFVTQTVSLTIKLAAIHEQEVELEIDGKLPGAIELPFGDQTFSIQERDGKYYMPAEALQHISRPDFAIVGYGVSTDGWRDPTEFLSEAFDRFPRAEFGNAPRKPVSKRP